MFRCANDIFAYCVGEPESLESPETYYYTEVTGKKIAYIGTAKSCLKHKNTCGLYRTFAESLLASHQLSKEAK